MLAALAGVPAGVPIVSAAATATGAVFGARANCYNTPPPIASSNARINNSTPPTRWMP